MSTYLFVDGAWLEATKLEYERRWKLPAPMTINYAGLKAEVDALKCFYYDAPPDRKEKESEQAFAEKLARAEARFNEIESHDGWHVNFGMSRAEGNLLRQKGVDVKLAIDAVSHRIKGNFSTAVILAGDLDFLPLIRALVELGAWVTLYTDILKVPKELKSAADSRRYLAPLTGEVLRGPRLLTTINEYSGLLPTGDFNLRYDSGQRTQLFLKNADGSGVCYDLLPHFTYDPSKARLRNSPIEVAKYHSYEILETYMRTIHTPLKITEGPVRFE